MIIYNPRQSVLITCKGKINQFGKEVEKEDIIASTWHSPSNLSPPKYSIFIHNKTLANTLIKQSKTFVVNFVSHNLVENINLAGKHHGEFQNKFEKIGLTMESCSKLLDGCKIKESIGWLECEVVHEHEFEDHTLFVGKAIYSEIKDREAKRPFHIENEDYTTTK